MQHNDNHVHPGSVQSPLRQMHHNQRENALIHLHHDFSEPAVKFLSQHYDLKQLENGVLLQRAEMTVAGTLYDAEGKLVGKIDLAKLGVAAEHVSQIEALQQSAPVPTFALPPRTVAFAGEKRSPLDHATRPVGELGQSA